MPPPKGARRAPTDPIAPPKRGCGRRPDPNMSFKGRNTGQYPLEGDESDTAGFWASRKFELAPPPPAQLAKRPGLGNPHDGLHAYEANPAPAAAPPTLKAPSTSLMNLRRADLDDDDDDDDNNNVVYGNAFLHHVNPVCNLGTPSLTDEQREEIENIKKAGRVIISKPYQDDDALDNKDGEFQIYYHSTISPTNEPVMPTHFSDPYAAIPRHHRNAFQADLVDDISSQLLALDDSGYKRAANPSELYPSRTLTEPSLHYTQTNPVPGMEEILEAYSPYLPKLSLYFKRGECGSMVPRKNIAKQDWLGDLFYLLRHDTFSQFMFFQRYMLTHPYFNSTNYLREHFFRRDKISIMTHETNPSKSKNQRDFYPAFRSIVVEPMQILYKTNVDQSTVYYPMSFDQISLLNYKELIDPKLTEEENLKRVWNELGYMIRGSIFALWLNASQNNDVIDGNHNDDPDENNNTLVPLAPRVVLVKLVRVSDGPAHPTLCSLEHDPCVGVMPLFRDDQAYLNKFTQINTLRQRTMGNFAVNTQTSYFSVEHVFASLQKMATRLVPFEKYLFPSTQRQMDSLAFNDTLPNYLPKGQKYDLSSLVTSPENLTYLRRKEIPTSEFANALKDVEITLENNESLIQDLKRLTSLDDSQVDALHKALTQEVSIIQGPPGTGKSFIGSRIVTCILKNTSFLPQQSNLDDIQGLWYAAVGTNPAEAEFDSDSVPLPDFSADETASSLSSKDTLSETESDPDPAIKVRRQHPAKATAAAKKHNLTHNLSALKDLFVFSDDEEEEGPKTLKANTSPNQAPDANTTRKFVFSDDESDKENRTGNGSESEISSDDDDKDLSFATQSKLRLASKVSSTTSNLAKNSETSTDLEQLSTTKIPVSPAVPEQGAADALPADFLQEYKASMGQETVKFTRTEPLQERKQNKPWIGPILLACYTNHALDQFMEGLLNKGVKSITRIGGGCKSDQLRPFGFRTQLSRFLRTPAGIELSGKYNHARYPISLEQETVRNYLEELHVVLRKAQAGTLRFPPSFVTYLKLYTNEFSWLSSTRLSEDGTLALLHDWLIEGPMINLNIYDSVDRPVDPISQKQINKCKQGVLRPRKRLDDHDPDSTNDFNLFVKNTANELGLNAYPYQVVYNRTNKTGDGFTSVKSKKMAWRSDHPPPYAFMYTFFDEIRRPQGQPPSALSTEQDNQRRRLYDVPLAGRTDIIRTCFENYKAFISDLILNYQEYCAKLDKRLSMLNDVYNAHNLKYYSVIGMTVTRLTSSLDLMSRLGSKVMVIEEAAEVHEAHVLSCLFPTLEQLIMIGDHLQLRPKTTHDLSTESRLGHDFDVSLFERLVRQQAGTNRFLVTLSTQRRMRPEIGQLIKATLYPELTHGENVYGYPPILGTKSSLFLFDHRHAESNTSSRVSEINKEYFLTENKESDELFRESLGVSKHNVWEAEMAVSMAMHYVSQGYHPHEIAIITPYKGQLKVIKRLLCNQFLSYYDVLTKKILRRNNNNQFMIDYDMSSKARLGDCVRLATVDNFQGEESKIVIVSTVRNNAFGSVGFLSSTNRLNVMLSRAMEAMVVLCDLRLLLTSRDAAPYWKKLYNEVKRQEHALEMRMMGDTLPLDCRNHVFTFPAVADPKDFAYNAPNGGCVDICGFEFECKCLCTMICHHFDRMHEVYVCPNHSDAYEDARDRNRARLFVIGDDNQGRFEDRAHW